MVNNRTMDKRVENLGKYARKGAPGRPKGGRRETLNALDAMLKKTKNIKALKEDLQKEFDKGPTRFFKNIVIPVLPKEAKIETTGIIDPEVLREIFLNNVEYRAGQSPTDAAEADRFDADTGELSE